MNGDDGISPLIRMDSIGKHDIGVGSSQQSIMESLVLKPLDRMGKKITDVDKYAVELQNPEVTVPAGSGNVPLTNYRMIGALAEGDSAFRDRSVCSGTRHARVFTHPGAYTGVGPFSGPRH